MLTGALTFRKREKADPRCGPEGRSAKAEAAVCLFYDFANWSRGQDWSWCGGGKIGCEAAEMEGVP